MREFIDIKIINQLKFKYSFRIIGRLW